jgi:hypothetical protein
MATELYGSESRLLRSKPLKRWYYGLFNGASEEVRTLDIHLGKVVLYQLSYARLLKIGKPVWNAGHVNIVLEEISWP